jgi:iron complex outermembrane receptor protein
VRDNRRHGRHFATVLATAAMIGGGGWAATAHAEESDAAEDGAIVVTAQRRSQSLSDLGIAITAVRGETLSEKGVQAPEQLWQVVPGLVVKDAGYGVPNYTLRGVGFENYFVNSSSTVGLYADEVAIPYPILSRGAFFDLERIEVLKGPQGDLYGRNTTAGQINLIARKPTREFEGGVSLEYGRFSSVNAEGYASGPLTEGVQARLSASAQLSSGWQRSLTRPNDKPLGSKDQIALRGQVNVDLGPDSSLLLRANWLRDNSDNIASTPVDGRTLGLPSAQARVATGTVAFSSGDNRVADWTPAFRPSRHNRQAGGSATLNAGLGGLTLTAISAYDHFKRDELNDFDGAAHSDSNARNISDIKAFSQEVRLADQDDADGLTWIVGGYFSRDKVREDYRFYMPDSFFGNVLGIKALNTRYRQNTKSLAGFAHGELNLAENLKVIGGVRVTRETRRFAGCTYDLDGSLTRFVNSVLIPNVIKPQGFPVPANMQPGGCSVYDDRVSSPTYGTFADAEERSGITRWLGKAGIEYQAAPNTLLYATASSGFKSGGFNGANANLKSQQASYNPERLYAYEAGVKTTLRSIGLYAEASAFFYDYRNKQTNGTAVTFVGNITGITNIPRSRIHGAEALLRWTPVEGLALEASGTWLDSKIRRWIAVSPLSSYPTIRTYDAAGLELPNTPRWSINLSPSYRFDVGGARHVKLGVDYLYRSRTPGAGIVFQEAASYQIVNAQISVGDNEGRWTVGLWGRNIFNEYYYNYAGLPANTNYVRIVGPPRDLWVAPGRDAVNRAAPARFPADAGAVVGFAAITATALLAAPAIAAQLAAEWRLSPSAIGFYFTVEQGGMCLATLPAIWWLKHVAWRKAALVAGSLFILANLLSTQADSLGWLLPLRGVSSLAGGSLMVLSMTLAGRSSQSERLFGLWVLGQLVVGAVLLFLLPRLFAATGLWTLYLILAGLMALAIALLARGLPDEVTVRQSDRKAGGLDRGAAAIGIGGILVY